MGKQDPEEAEGVEAKAEDRRRAPCAPASWKDAQMELLRLGLGGRPGSSLLVFLLSLWSGRLVVQRGKGKAGKERRGWVEKEGGWARMGEGVGSGELTPAPSLCGAQPERM